MSIFVYNRYRFVPQIKGANDCCWLVFFNFRRFYLNSFWPFSSSFHLLLKLLFCYVEGYLNLILFEFEFQCSIGQMSFLTLKGSFYQNFEEVCLKLKHVMLWKVQAFLMPTVKLECQWSHFVCLHFWLQRKTSMLQTSENYNSITDPPY